MTRSIEYSSRFERDLRMAQKRGKDIGKLKRLVVVLSTGEQLPANLHDHPLKGSWAGYRDVHIEPDWVLIYKLTNHTLRLQRLGTHSDLFDE